ncbi:MAG TPA: hypothetical protein VHV55_13985 [Pirellulales bacterium]|jgi:hypothetical protein|nr:hypothetical protein [Pirellulales bacterium]
MSQQNDGLKVLLIVMFLGALVIAMLSYGCSSDDQPGAGDEPNPVFSR